jgi:hypothetical protein
MSRVLKVPAAALALLPADLPADNCKDGVTLSAVMHKKIIWMRREGFLLVCGDVCVRH